MGIEDNALVRVGDLAGVDRAGRLSFEAMNGDTPREDERTEFSGAAIAVAVDFVIGNRDVGGVAPIPDWPGVAWKVNNNIERHLSLVGGIVGPENDFIDCSAGTVVETPGWVVVYGIQSHPSAYAQEGASRFLFPCKMPSISFSSSLPIIVYQKSAVYETVEILWDLDMMSS